MEHCTLADYPHIRHRHMTPNITATMLLPYTCLLTKKKEAVHVLAGKVSPLFYFWLVETLTDAILANRH